VDNIGFKFWYTGAAANENRVEVLIDKSLKNMLHVRLYVCGPAPLLGCRRIRVRVSPESIYVTFLYAIDNEFQFPIWYQLAKFCFSNSTFAAPRSSLMGGWPPSQPLALPFLPRSCSPSSPMPAKTGASTLSPHGDFASMEELKRPMLPCRLSNTRAHGREHRRRLPLCRGLLRRPATPPQRRGGLSVGSPALRPSPPARTTPSPAPRRRGSAGRRHHLGGVSPHGSPSRR
jgi:hypothetical protein